jgi:hypothetical protein
MFGSDIYSRPETEQKTVKEYTLTGKPETDQERIRRLREEADRNKEKARYNRSRARLLLTYADEQGELDPLLKQKITERQFIAKQFDQDAAQDRKEADELDAQIKSAETQKTVAGIQAGARETQALAGLRAGEAERRAEEISNMQSSVQSVMRSYNEGKFGKPGSDDAKVAFVQGLMNSLTPGTIMMMAQNMDKSVQDTLDTIRALANAEMTGQTEEGVEVAPGQAIGLLWTLLGETPPEF